MKTKVLKKEEGLYMINDINKFSSYKKLPRITAYVLHFTGNCRSQPADRGHGPCVAHEEENSAMLYIRSGQKQHYIDEYMTLTREKKDGKILPRLRRLKLFLNENRILRCKGRMENASYMS